MRREKEKGIMIGGKKSKEEGEGEAKRDGRGMATWRNGEGKRVKEKKNEGREGEREEKKGENGRRENTSKRGER